MSVSDVANQVGLLNSEGYVTRYDDRGRAYRVIPRVMPVETTSPDAILDLPIRHAGWRLIPLGAVASLERVTAPRALTRFQQKNAFKIFGGVIPGTTKEQGLAFIEQRRADILPAGYVSGLHRRIAGNPQRGQYHDRRARHCHGAGLFCPRHSVQQLQRPSDHSYWGQSPSRCLLRWSSPLSI